MPPTRRDIMNSGLSDQEAILKKIVGPKKVVTVKKVIPGGASLLDQVPQEDMEKAVYNWLRFQNTFSEVILSFAKDMTKFKTLTEKVISFDASNPPWDANKEGKRSLAKVLANEINKTSALAFHVKKDGIYVITDVEDKFAPTVKITKESFEELKQKTLAKKLATLRAVTPKSKKISLTKEQEEAIVAALPKVGEELCSPDWEPYLEFKP